MPYVYNMYTDEPPSGRIGIGTWSFLPCDNRSRAFRFMHSRLSCILGLVIIYILFYTESMRGAQCTCVRVCWVEERK